MLQWTKLIARNVAKVKAASTAAKLCATMSVAYSDSNLEPHALSYQESLSFACLILAYSRKDSVWIEWHLCWACAVCCQDFFEPKPKSRAIGTVGSVMTDGLFLLGCSSSEEKKKVWRDETRLTNREGVRAAATAKAWLYSGRDCNSLPHPRRQKMGLTTRCACTSLELVLVQSTETQISFP